MKIILSRKGFDTSNGSIPSPIMPDGTLLSMPIPSGDTISFDDLQYGKNTYNNILKQLAPKYQYDKCHLDPDIREGVRTKTESDWKPAFGQIGAAQTYLKNNQIEAGDLFLFFGRFKQTTGDIEKGTLHFDKSAPILHIIYGYMEIGEIVASSDISNRNYTWHPHGYGERICDTTNVLYLPSETLSFDKARRGWGVFDFSEKLILTLADKTATWREVPALMPDNIISKRKNSANGQGIYYKGIWQEMVLKENNISLEWAKNMFVK